MLDLGCGLGAYHSGLEGKFRELHGVDVLARSIELAAAQHPFVHYSTFDGSRLPYRDGQFSIAFTVCVMHHVPLPQWTSFAAEMFRVTGVRTCFDWPIQGLPAKMAFAWQPPGNPLTLRINH